jgi:Zn-finger protein
MRELNDWRLTNQERYLKGATLVKRSYEPASKENDHDHCEFCFAKFMTAALPETIHEGYATPDGYRWVCINCFEDFVDLFEWEVQDEA